MRLGEELADGERVVDLERWVQGGDFENRDETAGGVEFYLVVL